MESKSIQVIFLKKCHFPTCISFLLSYSLKLIGIILSINFIDRKIEKGINKVITPASNKRYWMYNRGVISSSR